MIHELFKEKVKLGKKGQITIPKCIRDEDNLKEDDVFIVQHMPGGDIILSKQISINTPEDLMIEAIMSAPPFDADAAWEEIKRERRQDR